jgi:hypothetical protein
MAAPNRDKLLTFVDPNPNVTYEVFAAIVVHLT